MVTAEERATQGGTVTVKGVRKIFWDSSGHAVNALETVDLNIQAGQFVSLVGPSGCGKSTLLRLIAGLDSPSEGDIRLDDESVRGAHYSRGLVFQDPTLFPWLTVRRNIALGLEVRGVARHRREEVEEYIRLVGLTGFENAFPHQLSGGMAQRAALARALVNHPKVLLLDEPFGALDAFTRMQMQDEILRIWDSRGTTMIFVTHDIDEAIFLSHSIIVMSARPGRIREIVDVPLGRPRVRSDPDFFVIRNRIMTLLNLVWQHDLEYAL